MNILNKMFSGRVFMVVCFTSATCYGFVKGKLSGEAFLPVMILVAEWYFKRDRPNDNNNNQQNGGNGK